MGLCASLLSALLLTLLILLGLGVTFAVTKLLSQTVLKGVPSSFTLELPPYRKPQIGKVIVRSIWDRTLFVLGRAAAVAAPAGMLLWGMANVTVGGVSLLNHCANFLDPVRPADGVGWGDFDGIYSGVSRQRDRAAHRHYGLSGTGQLVCPWTIYWN